MLHGKKIILGISGSIAAYKSAVLTRLLKKEGAEVKVVMTEAAATFITPLTLSTLSKEPVLIDFVKNKSGEWNNHVDLGLWADIILIAPASANTLSKMANGGCDNLLLATYLSAKCTVMVAPAMDLDMFKHQTTIDNLKKLEGFGNIIIDAEDGELASGLSGKGRMAEPESIVEAVENHFSVDQPFNNKKILITAGPTHEKIDPVRFIGNRSSGKMGYALAERAAALGAKITLVSGPSSERVLHKNIELVKVESAAEMYEVSMSNYRNSDIAIFAAAVADYTPKEKFDQKLKKTSDTLSLDLIKTKDIAAALGKLKKESQFNIGFALETQNELENALKKIQSKNFDLIILNSLQDKGAGFGHDTNKITIIGNDNKTQKFELKNKHKVAEDILNAIIAKINA